jgi:hypothetical protein
MMVQLIKKLSTETSLPCSQGAATGPYPEADKSIPHSHTLFLEDPS